MDKSAEELGSQALDSQAERKETAWDKLRNTKTMAEAPSEKEEPTPSEAEEIHKQKVAKVSQVLSRGILNEKLSAVFNDSVPEGWGGRFVRDTEDDIIRYSNLNFGFTYRKGAKGLHEGGDGRVRVGDLVLMTISPEDRAVLKEAKLLQVRRKLEEGRRQYARDSEKAPPGIQPFDESEARVVKSRTRGR
jgi:hypothetical protein